jgi:nucleotide-binding universal stress UspA family protein
MVQKILVALDGSRASESILPYIEALLGTSDANLTLLTVTRPGSARQARAAKAYLNGQAAPLREKGAFVDVALAQGKPAAEIVRAAHAGAYDLLAMSSRGKSGLRRLVLGSVAEEVLRRASLPVFVSHPLPKGISPASLRSIVVPLDGSHRSASVLPLVTELAKRCGSKVAFVSVVSPTRKDDLPVETAAHNLFAEQKALQKEGLEVELAILYGDPATEILRFAEARGASLLALATHGRTGLDRLRYGSVAEALVRKTSLPMLVVRTAAVVRERVLHPRAVAARRRALETLASAGEVPKSPYSR